MPQSLRDSLRGCYEIPLFLARGVERFENTKAAFYQSLLVPLLFIPLQVPVAALDPPLSGLPVLSLFIIMTYRTVVGTAFFLGGVWLLCWPLDRREHFFRFATAYNWLSLPAWILLLPYAVLVGGGAVSVQQMGGYLIFFVGMVCTLVAFAARIALKTGWGIAICIGLGALAADLLAASLL